jgi:undecaprenyl-diphosphatase
VVTPQVWQPIAPPTGKALLIGVAQALAMCPGISRSGATITAGLWAGLPRAEAARFSFLLSVPAIAGAALFQLLKGEMSTRAGWAGLFFGAAVAFMVGLVAIRWTARAVVFDHFWKFSFYCISLGLGVLLILGF